MKIKYPDLLISRFTTLVKLNNFYFFKNFFFDIFKYLIISLENLILSNKQTTNHLSEKKSNLIISHYINSSNLENDHIFGKFDKNFNNQTIRLLINGSRKKNIKTLENSNIIFLPRRLYFIDEIKISFLIIKIFFSKIIIKQFGYIFYPSSLITKDTFFNFRIATYLNFLVKSNNFSKIITTFEGHPWENYIFKKFKKINTYGYIHTFIKKDTTLFEKKIYPNYFLTTGIKMNHQLKKFNIKNILVLGSKKFDKKKIKFQKKISNKILVIPEALSFEESLFYKFCSNRTLNNFKFYFKFHPASNFKFLQKKNFILLNEDEFNKINLSSYIILYRGSSFIYELLKYDIIPLYLNLTAVNKDPFFEINKLLVIQNSDELINFYNNFKINQNFTYNLNSIREYYLNYHENLNFNILDEKK